VTGDPQREYDAALAAIKAGTFDARLHVIERAIDERRQEQAAELGIRPGVRVEFTATCPEEYLRGCTERVREVQGRTVLCGDVSVLLTWFDRDYVEVIH
jgi:hypothetical protein